MIRKQQARWAFVCVMLSCVSVGNAQFRGADGFNRDSRSHRGRDDQHYDDRDNRNRNDRRSGPATSRTVRYGTTVTQLPSGHKEVVVSGTRYYTYQGTCYSRGPRSNTYVVVRPPRGIVVTHLPSDYQVVRIRDRNYYYYDDCYYNDRLEVVDCPEDGWITQLPGGYETIDNRDQRLFRIGDQYYKAILRDGRTVYVRISYRPGDARPSDWKLLGSEKLSFRSDEETIRCGLLRGRFRELRIEVNGGDLEMQGLTVQFVSGETFSPRIQHQFREGSRSRSIDLPGDERFIKEIRIRGKSRLSLGGKATVSIFAR